jgi:hypothetical protein
MYALTNNMSILMGLTATAMVLGLVSVFFIQFLSRFARQVLENLNL